MQFSADEHVQIVLEFLQSNIPANKLMGIAECLPQMARLLWGHFQQEPFIPIELRLPKMVGENPSLQVATESSPVQACADGGSEGVATCP